MYRLPAIRFLLHFCHNCFFGPTRDTNGQILIYSSPSGANIYLDNAYKGITPLILPNVPVGSHTVTLRMNGYQDLVKPVNVIGGSTVDGSGTLSAGSQPNPSAPAPPANAIPDQHDPGCAGAGACRCGPPDEKGSITLFFKFSLVSDGYIREFTDTSRNAFCDISPDKKGRCYPIHPVRITRPIATIASPTISRSPRLFPSRQLSACRGEIPNATARTTRVSGRMKITL